MKKIFFAFFAFSVVFTSCDKDNKNSDLQPPRDVSEVAVADDIELQEYLKTHFYNETKQENGFNGVVGLDTIAGNNNSATSLWKDKRLKTKIIKVKDANNKLVDHKLYYIILKEGKGKQATVADSTLVKYKTQLLNGSIVDAKEHITSFNDYFDLLKNDEMSIIRTGFRESVALLKDTDETPIVNNDGTFGAIKGFGSGIFFMPSRLAYFNQARGFIPSYSPLIYTINLYKTKNADHDGDGIPSIKEIEVDEFGVITFKDCNKNRIPDYIDPKNCK